MKNFEQKHPSLDKLSKKKTERPNPWENFTKVAPRLDIPVLDKKQIETERQKRILQARAEVLKVFDKAETRQR